MSRAKPYLFRLYVAGDAPNSAQALANLSALCAQHLADRHQIEVIDVFRTPRQALADGILMTPTLVKLSPLPSHRVVGNLSQSLPLLLALGLPEALPS